MVADQLNRTEGTQMQAAHYRGESPMWVDLASGQIQIAVGSYQSFATVASRGVKPIAVTGNYRNPKLPDVPTAQQQGAETERAAKLREQFAIPSKPRNLKDTRADWDRDVPVWVKLAVDLGIKLD